MKRITERRISIRIAILQPSSSDPYSSSHQLQFNSKYAIQWQAQDFFIIIIILRGQTMVIILNFSFEWDDGLFLKVTLAFLHVLGFFEVRRGQAPPKYYTLVCPWMPITKNLNPKKSCISTDSTFDVIV